MNKSDNAVEELKTIKKVPHQAVLSVMGFEPVFNKLDELKLIKKSINNQITQITAVISFFKKNENNKNAKLYNPNTQDFITRDNPNYSSWQLKELEKQYIKIDNDIQNLIRKMKLIEKNKKLQYLKLI